MRLSEYRCDANRVVGIFTERDVLKKLAPSGRDPGKVPVSELMTTPVETHLAANQG